MLLKCDISAAARHFESRHRRRLTFAVSLPRDSR